ncbi:MAG: ATP-binding cassette domain-containing protein [Gammaproteobacteria bacterium]|nr:ATP-binding cassette domain-containing protein [Gammaproteobacteria bacterium]
MAATPLAEVHNLTRYYGDLRAVNSVSFTIHPGEILGFLGPNGAGKTTTMQILTGNLAPSDGDVRINGHDLLAEPRQAKAALGYLPEQPPVYRDLTVDEYLDYCAALHRIPRPRRREMREAAKSKCGLSDVGRRVIGNLSKGYQQRVGIAQAIIHLPPLVILDEPTIGLDPIQIREIRALIRELGKDHGVILSTHILPEVQATCDRVQIINKGSLVLSDTIDGLARHLKSAALIVGLRQPPALTEIEHIAGVRGVSTIDGSHVRVLHEPGQDPTDEIVRLATERHWGLHEIGPERASLEQIFVELTAAEQTIAAETPA